MSDLCGSVEHPGIILEVKDKVIRVKIEHLSACSQCHAKSACLTSDRSEKIIEVRRGQRIFKEGDLVTVVMEEKKGVLAVFLAYLLPFFIVFLTLLIVLALTKKEVVSGVLAVGSLVPYYLILWVLRDKIKSEFQFRLKL